MTYSMYSFPSLENDPLNEAQKRAIKVFVDDYLLANEDIAILDYYSKEVIGTRKKNLLEDLGFVQAKSCLKALSKTYDSYDPQSYNIAKEKLQVVHQSHEKNFNVFRSVFKDPSKKAKLFDLDVNIGAQVFAAQKFMKVLICNSATNYNNNFVELQAKYRNKMASKKGANTGNTISSKNVILMQNDPVKKLDPTKPFTALDIVLANTHFETPQAINEMRTRKPNEQEVVTTEIYGPTREEARRLIQREITKLYHSPELKHVINALAVLILNEKGNIIFAASPLGVSKLANSIDGFYNSHHTITVASLINPVDTTINIHSLGTFVHETLHFLFSRIVLEKNSPVKKDSSEEALLDQALNKDREHRKKLVESDEEIVEQPMWVTLVDNLEKEINYFQGGFNSSNPNHLHIMRMEAIVRIMEKIAEGVSIEDIKKIAPNLFDFYYSYSKKMLEKYFKDHRYLFSHENNPSPFKIHRSKGAAQKQRSIFQRIASVCTKKWKQIKKNCASLVSCSGFTSLQSRIKALFSKFFRTSL